MKVSGRRINEPSWRRGFDIVGHGTNPSVARANVTVHKVIRNVRVRCRRKTVFDCVPISMFLQDRIVVDLYIGNVLDRNTYIGESPGIGSVVVDHVVSDRPADTVVPGLSPKPDTPITIDDQVLLNQRVCGSVPEVDRILDNNIP